MIHFYVKRKENDFGLDCGVESGGVDFCKPKNKSLEQFGLVFPTVGFFFWFFFFQCFLH